jgi:hypothetical protein
MAPLKGETACMDALSRLFPAHYGTQRVAPTGHVPSVPTTREWKKPLGFNRCGECHTEANDRHHVPDYDAHRLLFI